MGRLQEKVAECKYREYDRLLTEQFIGDINDKGMTNGVLREVAMLEDIEEATSECILTCPCRVGVQWDIINLNTYRHKQSGMSAYRQTYLHASNIFVCLHSYI